jgi:putative phage-type endonuclease
MLQRTEEWFAARAGKATSSRVADLTARTKNGWGAARKNAIAALVTERLTGQCVEIPQTAAMAWGTEKEDEARDLYSLLTGDEVAQVGFVDHPSIEWAGASPDGLVGDDGLLEVKCPNTATHIDTLMGGAIPERYMKQMAWQMDCTGRDWCAFVSYDPRMPPAMQLHIGRVDRDEELIKQLRDDVMSALEEVEKAVKQLKEQYA